MRKYASLPINSRVKMKSEYQREGVQLGIPETPAIIYDERCLLEAIESATRITKAAGCRLFYSPKACAFPSVITVLSEHVDGFACSSLFEGRLLNGILSQKTTLHLTSPGLTPTDIDEISRIFDVVVLNSFTHLHRIDVSSGHNVKLGIRINPMLSFVSDSRYDPCARNSKLGVPIDQFLDTTVSDPEILTKIDGLHLHNNCDSVNAYDMVRTVQIVREKLSPVLGRMSWINLGGGYLFDQLNRPDHFVEAVQELRKRFDLEVFLEPGCLSRKAGSMVSRVVDLFDGDDLPVAVLDTSVNHMPEVLEYQFAPDIQGNQLGSANRYLLAGASCLAGDRFGIYEFTDPLEIGSLVTFLNVGAYSFSRANVFNGLPLPHVYRRTVAGNVHMARRAMFTDYLRLNSHDCI